jgi:hypothetical protein
MSDFDTGDFVLQPVKPKPKADYEVYRIGANVTRFYYAGDDLQATLYDVHITLTHKQHKHGCTFYDIHCMYGDGTVTYLHEHEWAIGGTLSQAIATIRKLSTLEAWHMGLSVRFMQDNTRTYETYAGYIRVCYSYDHQLYCYSHAEDDDDIPNVEWRYKQEHSHGLFTLSYGAFESAQCKAGKPHLRTILSYIEEAE